MAFCASCGKELPANATFCPNCGASVGATSQPSSQAPMSGIDAIAKDSKAQQYWVERFVAFIIDAVIVYVILAIITVAIAIPALLSGGATFFGAVFGGIAFLWGIIFVLYFTFSESTQGASIGKKIFHLKVVSKTNANPTFVEAFIRNLSKIYWLLLLLDVIVGLATSKGYQEKFSDHYVGTKVVK